MNISKNGLELIKHFEGLSLKAYKCPAGINTIGYGHTNKVKITDVISLDEANAFLLIDLRQSENLVNSNIKVKISQSEFDALVSLAFNLTLKSFKMLAGYVNVNKDIFRSKILLYCKDINGKVLQGLRTRRKAELMLFNGMDFPLIKQSLNL